MGEKTPCTSLSVDLTPFEYLVPPPSSVLKLLWSLREYDAVPLPTESIVRVVLATWLVLGQEYLIIEKSRLLLVPAARHYHGKGRDRKLTTHAKIRATDAVPSLVLPHTISSVQTLDEDCGYLQKGEATENHGTPYTRMRY